MSELIMGIPYFGVQTDIKDDDKIFELKYRYATKGESPYDYDAAYAAFGRFVGLLAAIYCDGFAVKMTAQRRMRLSQQFGLSMEDFQGFLDECVDIGLFDKGLWEREAVITSTGIQKRYFNVTIRRHGEIPAEQVEWLLVEPPEHQIAATGKVQPHGTQACEVVEPDTMHAAEGVQLGEMQASDVVEPELNPTRCSNIATSQEQDKRREDKKREGKLKGREDKGAPAQSSGDIVSRLSRTFSTDFDNRSKKLTQPYPLSCFGISDGEHVFDDGMGNKLDTPWDAIARHLKYRSPDVDIGAFARQVIADCPVDCDESMERVCECHALMSRALDRFDARKCKNPIPLICKVLREDRKGGDANV